MPVHERAIIRPISQVKRERVERATGAFIQVALDDKDGVPNFLLRRFTIEPGGRIPNHSHPNIEHEQYVLEGEMVMGMDGEEATVRAGDVVFIPAKVSHWYENRSDAPVVFLCIVPRTVGYATVWANE